MIVVGVAIYHTEKFPEATTVSHKSHGGAERYENVGVFYWICSGVKIVLIIVVGVLIIVKIESNIQTRLELIMDIGLNN